VVKGEISMLEVQLLLLIGIANGTPVIIKKLFGNLWALPLDGGRKLSDQRPIFGPSKTVRGIVFSLLVTLVCAPPLGIHWYYGLLIAAAAMAGDLISSFIKRRMGKPSSAMALGIDQVPESLFPMFVAHYILEVSWLGVIVVTLLFFILELGISKILYRLKIRNEPY
jgi:CDP-diglyceride synthetase